MSHSTSLRAALSVSLFLGAASAGLAQSAPEPRQQADSGASPVVRSVEIDASLYTDKVSDPEEMERREVRSLNQQAAAQRAAIEARAALAQREHELALAKAEAQQRAYDEALAAHRAAMEAWQRKAASNPPPEPQK